LYRNLAGAENDVVEQSGAAAGRPIPRALQVIVVLIAFIAGGLIFLAVYVRYMGPAPVSYAEPGGTDSSVYCPDNGARLPPSDVEPWDSRDIGRASIVRDDCLYRMWYSGTDSSHRYRIGQAISLDGTKWIRYSAEPVLVPGQKGDWDGRSISDPTVISTGSSYSMWYVGRASGGNASIGLATSADGTTWIKDLSSPVLRPDPAHAWESYALMQPTVIFDGNVYHVWYAGVGKAPADRPAIGCATSSDGRTWERCQPDPVLTADAGLDWEHEGVLEPNVVYREGVYHMWYTGIDAEGIERVGYARSNDGIHWTKLPDNPVLLPGDMNSWEGKGVFGPVVLLRQSAYDMWYLGSDMRSDGSRVRMGYAVSSDGSNWARPSHNPLFAPEQGGRYQNP
jgi:predicted GH43/DUF377 family glycosyl hydrolase